MNSNTHSFGNMVSEAQKKPTVANTTAKKMNKRNLSKSSAKKSKKTKSTVMSPQRMLVIVNTPPKGLIDSPSVTQLVSDFNR